jgi:hypothetical protein
MKQAPACRTPLLKTKTIRTNRPQRKGILMTNIAHQHSAETLEQKIDRLQNHAWIGDPAQRMGELHAVIATFWAEVQATRKTPPCRDTHMDAEPTFGKWQPMATAPKDGTEILLCDDSFSKPSYVVAHWHEAKTPDGITGWYCRGGLGDGTYWMPLLPPSAESSK